MKLELARYEHNPFLSPQPEVFWEAQATFNGCILKEKGKYYLVYRALSKKTDYQGKNLHLSTIGITESNDGLGFFGRRQLIVPENDWEKYGCEDPRITKLGGEFFIFYTALADFPPSAPNIRVGLAISTDLVNIKEKHLITPFNAKAMALFNRQINNQYVAILTVNTDLPPAKIAVARFNKKEEMWSNDYWRNWYQELDNHVIPLRRMNSDQVEVGAPPIETEYGWLLVYAYIKNYLLEAKRFFRIEAVLLDKNNPQNVIGRIHESLLEPEVGYEKQGMVPNVVFPAGALIENGQFHLYYGAADTACCRASCSTNYLFSKIQINDVFPAKLNKYADNPILLPQPEHNWEAKAVFNPAAIYLNNKIHLIYRALSYDNTSTFGYATTTDGYHINERLIEPIYLPRADFEDKKGRLDGNSGCEDPRATIINDRLYLTYTAYDGIHPPRVALTSIALTDFLNQHWVWEMPKLISPPEIDDKDSCIFPDKINNKYAIIHRINNDIVIDYVDSLNFSSNTWLKIIHRLPLRQEFWDEEKVGIATPPIKTKDGWFVLYHGISKIDHHYRVGAILLDLHNPSQVISRFHYPLLEPELHFEREGIVANVVFPCGAVVVNDVLFVYYGGADRVVGVATARFSQLIKQLLEARNKKFLTKL